MLFTRVMQGPNEMKTDVPEPALLRMPLYIHALKQMCQEDANLVMVSAKRLEDVLQLNVSQIRKDLAYTGLTGRPRVGFPVYALIEALERLVGCHAVREAYLVGAGRLAAALLSYQRIALHGVEVVAAFDHDINKLGSDFLGVPTYDVSELEDRVRDNEIDIGVIAVPHEAAQEVADKMIRGGILGIWNFAPVRLIVPDGVIVQNEDIFSSVVMLSQRIARRKRCTLN